MFLTRQIVNKLNSNSERLRLHLHLFILNIYTLRVNIPVDTVQSSYVVGGVGERTRQPTPPAIGLVARDPEVPATLDVCGRKVHAESRRTLEQVTAIVITNVSAYFYERRSN